RKTKPELHFTEIVLSNPHSLPVGRTLGKIKEHLCDIYRIFVREGILILKLNGEELVCREPDVLVAPYYKKLNGPAVRWSKEIDFDFGKGLRATGFAAIRKRASTTHAGFALFRRRRLIQGSGDEGYRPEFIFGKPNSFIYQRLFGELHLEGFEISHTKDGFQWDENEEPFLALLKEDLSRAEFPLLQQAKEHRVQRERSDYRRGAETAAQSTSDTIKEHVPPVMNSIAGHMAPEPPPARLAEATTASRRTIDIEFHGRPWRIVLELSDDPAVGEWLEISDQVAQADSQDAGGRRVIELRLSLAHPFMDRFGGVDPEQIEPLLRVAAALGLAEVAARESGVRMAGTVRRNVNELLKEALWKT
ncbi:MAG: ATP-binding protein, partial [Verrucomicrobia bacterium]|nr:ATP-binding protein [Verrucomicrobiota bacterium]